MAKRDIHVNGIIAAENPVFVMPVVTGWQRNVSKEEMFVILFERLKLEQREQALALANCKPNGVCGVHESILRTNGLSIELVCFQVPCLFRVQTTTDIVHRHAIKTSGISKRTCDCTERCLKMFRLRDSITRAIRIRPMELFATALSEPAKK